MNISKIIFASALILFVGCQQKPTKITVQEPLIGETLTAEALMKNQPVILDARPAFEFNLAHAPGAINVRWEDFSQNNPKSRGLLQADLFALARRLSLVGVDPESKVVVLGKGRLGSGEEGRIAWTLKVLGVKEVYTLVHTSYREMNATKEAPLTQNKPYWKPQVAENLSIDFKEFKNFSESEKKLGVIVDVRSAQEFALRNLTQSKGVKAQVLNLPWQDFFDDKGLPNKKIASALAENGITTDTRVIFISNHGVRSGAATYVLQYLGYKKAQNFAGGYEQWK
ncbi:MAG: ABC transporter ATP-binding protein [Bdellovibrio sp.]|nr:ABC transporter ATP-binding protein [Bdellovibrio sp.]